MKSSIIVLIISIALLGLVSGLTQKTDCLRDGEIIAFKTLGSIVNAQHTWLDGRTIDGSVGLAPNTEGIYTGTHWKVHDNRDGSFSFECLGNIKNAQHIWLDGRTIDGSNGLAPNTNAPWTGTRWSVARNSDNSYSFHCLGHILNNQHVFLDAHTVDGSTGLAPNNNYNPYSGTHWQLYTFDRPRFRIGTVVRSPVRTHHLKPLFNDGDIITLKCLGHIHNPQHLYINGRTTDGQVYLSPRIDGDDFSGTHWKVHKNCDGSYSFESLYVWLNTDHLFLDGRTVDGSIGLAPNTNAPWTGTRWHVERLCDGSIALKCLGNIINNQHVYLDGRTIDGSAGLAPNTNAPWTGTHWQFEKTYDPCCV